MGVLTGSVQIFKWDRSGFFVHNLAALPQYKKSNNREVTNSPYYVNMQLDIYTVNIYCIYNIYKWFRRMNASKAVWNARLQYQFFLHRNHFWYIYPDTCTMLPCRVLRWTSLFCVQDFVVKCLFHNLTCFTIQRSTL